MTPIESSSAFLNDSTFEIDFLDGAEFLLVRFDVAEDCDEREDDDDDDNDCVSRDCCR